MKYKILSIFILVLLNLCLGFYIGAYMWFGGSLALNSYTTLIALAATLFLIYKIFSIRSYRWIIYPIIALVIMQVQAIGISMGQVDYILQKPWNELSHNDWPEIRDTFYLALDGRL